MTTISCVANGAMKTIDYIKQGATTYDSDTAKRLGRQCTSGGMTVSNDLLTTGVRELLTLNNLQVLASTAKGKENTHSAIKVIFEMNNAEVNTEWDALSEDDKQDAMFQGIIKKSKGDLITVIKELCGIEHKKEGKAVAEVRDAFVEFMTDSFMMQYDVTQDVAFEVAKLCASGKVDKRDLEAIAEAIETAGINAGTVSAN